VDGPATSERNFLVDVVGRSQEVADLIKSPAEALRELWRKLGDEVFRRRSVMSAR
jgi:hypothetical protein